MYKKKQSTYFDMLEFIGISNDYNMAQNKGSQKLN